MRIEINITGDDIEHVEFWRRLLLKSHDELSPATDAAMVGKRYRVTLSQKSKLEKNG